MLSADETKFITSQESSGLLPPVQHLAKKQMAAEGRGRTFRVWAWGSLGVSRDVRGQQEGAGLHLQQSIREQWYPLCLQCHRTQISSWLL